MALLTTTNETSRGVPILKLQVFDPAVQWSDPSVGWKGALPVHVVKIGQAFVRSMTEDNADAVLVETMVDLAHKLHFHVVAEGVETDEAAAMLAQLDCEEGQGYLFSRPLNPRVWPNGWQGRKRPTDVHWKELAPDRELPAPVRTSVGVGSGPPDPSSRSLVSASQVVRDGKSRPRCYPQYVRSRTDRAEWLTG